MANQITKVYLLNVPLESDLKNTLYFANASTQQTYFQSRIQKSYTDFTYQRKDQFIRVPAQFDTLSNCNYIMYQNSAYSNKWFYAFITKMEYVDDNRTDVYIQTDVMQTYMFDITIKSSFVEREHVNNDTVGIHTVPENVETGDYINQPPDQPDNGGYAPSLEINYLLGNSQYVVIGTSEIVMDAAAPAPNYNGVFSGVYFIAFPSFSDARAYINYIQGEVANDPIVTIFMAPSELIMYDGFGWLNYPQTGTRLFQYGFVPSVATVTEITHAEITKPVSIDGYTPRNNKLLTYPYQFLELNNNAGSANVYQYEMFKGYGDTSSSTCNFSVRGVIGTGCSIQCIPINYNKTNQSTWNTTFNNYEEALDAPKLPTCSWTNDAYTNWLTQNAVNMGIGFVSSTVSMIGGAVLAGTGIGTGIGVGMMAGGLAGIGNSVAQIYEHSKVPNTAKGGVNQGDLMYSSKRSFSVYKKCIRNEYAQIIDEFFDMFGYKVNRVKVPNKAHRQRWWYTKCIDVNIDGAVPNEDMQKIKNAYNNGITFWRNASEIKNYSLSNNIV